jgi:hypothetical protein
MLKADVPHTLQSFDAVTPEVLEIVKERGLEHRKSRQN